MTVNDKATLIIQDIQHIDSTDPIVIFNEMVQKDYINMHGPEHHILDGACILTAYKNAGGDIDLNQALEKIMFEGLRMPGAMCGLWGVCGAVSSIGAALSIIDQTGPLTTDGSWGEHMSFTTKAINRIGMINGPRCCKRDGIIAIKNAIEYINIHYSVKLENSDFTCTYFSRNAQCIQERCPFHPK